MDKIKEILEEQLEHNRYCCDEKCYDVISDVINYYDFETEDEFRESIYEATGEAFIYYADAWDYLRNNNIISFQEAFNEGFGENVCSIATYYLEEEIHDFLHEAMDLSG